MFGFRKNDNINQPSKTSNTQRLTAKGLPVFEHRKYGRCIIITKEAQNGNWSLVGGGINYHEGPNGAITREISEEFGKKITIKREKDLGLVHTKTSVHRIFALQIEGILKLDTNELDGIGFYPLEDRFEDERKALESTMDYHAKVALHHFMNDRQNKKYQGSRVKIDPREFEKFKILIENTLKEIK